MSISVYSPPERPADEADRNRAVTESGILEQRDLLAVRNIVWGAAEMMGTEMAIVSVVHGDHQTVIAAAGIETSVGPRSQSVCGHAVLHPDRILCVPDMLEDERFAGNPKVIGPPFLRFYAGAPLVGPRGHAVGGLCVLSSRPRSHVSPGEQKQLRALADRLMAEVEQARFPLDVAV